MKGELQLRRRTPPPSILISFYVKNKKKKTHNNCFGILMGGKVTQPTTPVCCQAADASVLYKHNLKLLLPPHELIKK